MKRTRVWWILGILLLALMTLFPWIIGSLYAPLRPSVLEETATAYFVTESIYFTREAELELSATSQMITLPPEDYEPLPGDPDYTPPASSYSRHSDFLLVQVYATQVLFTGVSSLPLERFSCPSPSALIGGQFPPNQQFTAIGWNVDLDNITYLLIRDEPSLQQIWLRIPDLTAVQLSGNYLDLPAITCRTQVIYATPSHEQATAAVSDGTLSTPTIPPPRIASATPPPPEQVRLEITEQDAIQQVQESVPELSDPQIEFSPDNLQIRGNIDLPGPLGTTIQGNMDIIADLVQEDVDLRVVLRSVTVAGRDITNTPDGRQVENTINHWLDSLLIRRDLQTFEMLDGVLILEVLERQFSEFVAPQPTEEETSTPTPTLGEPTLTPTLIFRSLFETMTPLPLRTQTPLPTRTATS